MVNQNIAEEPELKTYIVDTSQLSDSDKDKLGLTGKHRQRFQVRAVGFPDVFNQLRSKLGLSGQKVNTIVSESEGNSFLDDINLVADRAYANRPGGPGRILNSQLAAAATDNPETFTTDPNERINREVTYAPGRSPAELNAAPETRFTSGSDTETFEPTPSVLGNANTSSTGGLPGSGSPNVDLNPAASYRFYVPELGTTFQFDAISEINARAQLDAELRKPKYGGVGNANAARQVGEGLPSGQGGISVRDGESNWRPLATGSGGGGGISPTSYTGSDPVPTSAGTGGTGGAGTPPVFPGVPDPGPALASAGDPAGAQLERPAAEALQPGEAFRAFLQSSGINPDSFGGNLFQSQLGPALTALSGLGSGVEGAGDATLSGLLGAGPIGPGRFGRLAAAALPGATANITGQPGFQALGEGGTFTDQGALLANLSRLSRGISPFASQFVNPSNADLEQQLRDFTFAQNTGTGGPVPKFSDFLNQAFRPLQGQLSQGLRAQAGF